MISVYTNNSLWAESKDEHVIKFIRDLAELMTKYQIYSIYENQSEFNDCFMNKIQISKGRIDVNGLVIR